MFIFKFYLSWRENRWKYNCDNGFKKGERILSSMRSYIYVNTFFKILSNFENFKGCCVLTKNEEKIWKCNDWFCACVNNYIKYILSKIGCKYISGIHVPSFTSIYSVCISIMVIIVMKSSLSLLNLPNSSFCISPDFNDFFSEIQRKKYFLFDAWKRP